ncbi:MAG: adenine deaminase C-terminal domain-containing protein [Armatimonadota bacterium]|nr:adenine deaminase C-terminal domain-containing protein [Armatimonadota bacterium]MDR5696176.1 adenine deaminase C-terminal domain-containing protein [Armatimonadota bacterium]
MWTHRSLDEIQTLMAVARGERPADLALVGGQVLLVQSGEIRPGDVAVAGRRIAYVGPDRPVVGPQTRVVDCTGKIVAPGYIEPHCHPAPMANPVEYARALLRTGTTTVVADTLFLLSHADPGLWGEFLEIFNRMPVQFLWFLRLHPQAHSPDEDRFELDLLETVLPLASVVTVGEVTRWADLYRGDESLLRKVQRARRAGKRAEGHNPGVSYARLQALVAAGLSSDHEAIDTDQARERLRAGLYVMLRHSSLRRDLPELAVVALGAGPAIGRVMMTADGADPAFIRRYGYMDGLVRVAMHGGIPPICAYAMATMNPATYYGLDEEIGTVAPGRLADLLVLRSLEDPTPELVVAKGQIAAEAGRVLAPFPQIEWERYFPARYAPAWHPRPEWFVLRGEGRTLSVPAIRLENPVITRREDLTLRVRDGLADLPEGVVLVALLDHRARWIVRTALVNFVRRLGGLASTYNVANEILVYGQDPDDMAAATRRVLELGGGVVLVEGGRTVFEFPLPHIGMAGPQPFDEVADRIERLTELLAARGYPHHDVPYTLMFLPFDSLPDLRLTYRGLWDVKAGRSILPREMLSAEQDSPPDRAK